MINKKTTVRRHKLLNFIAAGTGAIVTGKSFPESKHIRYFLLIFLLLPGYALAAVIGYLSIDGINGDVTIPAYQDMIEISGYGQGIESPITFGSGGPSGSGSPSFSAIRVSKAMDPTSPLLYVNAASGQAFANVKIHLVSETGYNYFSISMTNVYITAIIPSAGSATATEMISFTPETIQWTSKVDGQSNVTTGWNRSTNQAL